MVLYSIVLQESGICNCDIFQLKAFHGYPHEPLPLRSEPCAWMRGSSPRMTESEALIQLCKTKVAAAPCCAMGATYDSM